MSGSRCRRVSRVCLSQKSIFTPVRRLNASLNCVQVLPKLTSSSGWGQQYTKASGGGSSATPNQSDSNLVTASRTSVQEGEFAMFLHWYTVRVLSVSTTISTP